MLTRSQIQREEQQSKEQLRRIHEFVLQRDKSRADLEAWKNACREWHSTPLLCFYLWSQEAHDRMRRGEREVIEDALLFLEVDPWFFRTGYLKERVLRHLKGAPLNLSDRARLRHVIQMIVQGRNRRELRDYCRLALAVWTPEWEEELRAQAERASGSAKLPLGGNKLAFLLAFLDAHRDKLRAK